MRETDFIAKNQEKWERYEESLKRSDQDPELLNQLYIHLTDDLSISRTFYPNRSVRVYLNGLAQRTFLQLYRGRRGELYKFFTFWTDELPRIVHANRRCLLIALLVFLLALLIGVVSYRIDPDFAEIILGRSYVDMTEANIAGGDPMAVYKARNPFDMALQITLNNLLVALLTFVAGIFLCVGSVVMLVRTGVMVGVFQYFFYARGDYASPEIAPAAGWLLRGLSGLLTAGGEGLETVFTILFAAGAGAEVFRESLLTIWIHGTLEISSTVIAGGAGITLGSGLLFPGTLTRLQAFGRSARDGLKLLLGTVPLFLMAGFLEGYVTRQTDLPDALRLVFILVCLAFIAWYYVVYPRAVVKNGPRVSDGGRLPADSRMQRYPFYHIRSLGEQLSVTFAVLLRSLGRLLGGATLLSAVYCLFAFAFGGAAAFRYTFVSYPFGDLENVYELTASVGRGRALSFSLLVALGFYGMFRLALGAVFRATDLVRPHPSFSRELRLAAVSGLLALCLAFGGTAVALLVFLLFPYLMVLAVGGYATDGTPGPVFRLVYANLSSSYGIFFLVLLLAFPLIFLLDSVLGGYFFAFLDWVVYTEPSTIDARNVVLQAFCYYFFLVLIFCTGAVAYALSLGSLLEIATAGTLRKRIDALGRKRRLRGMERE